MDEYGQPGNVMQLTGPESGTTADDLRRLARWFDVSTSGQAHDLFAAAFGLYGARHLGTVPGPGAALPAHTSWWHGPAAGPAPLPAALRVPTARGPRGRALPEPGAEPRPAGATGAPRHARPLRPAADGAQDDSASAERRAAARLLLAHPLITATGPWAASLPQIRRHSDALAQRFDRFLGYRLEVDEHAARLFKAGLGTGCGRGLRRPGDGAPFTPGSYAALALVLATLPDLPAGPTPAELRAEVRSTASAAGLQDAVEEDRLADALAVLIDRQVIGAAEDGRLLVHHGVARLLPAGPLADAADGDDLVRRAADPGPGGERTYVRRRLAENPVVLLDELTRRERGWLRTRQRREAETFADFLGLEAEIRAEGVALLDPADELSDLDPGPPGTAVLARAALLLAERLVEQLRPVPGDAVSRTAAGPVIGVPVPDAAIDGVLGDVADEYGARPGWPAGYLADRAALRCDVLELLHRMQLMAPAGPVRADTASDQGAEDDGGSAVADVRGARGEAATGWVLLAPAARYAPGAQAVPARPGRHARTQD
ncbi:DUF2398 family protein [Peterkaempfera sp. SMS 1(5)a]|uniref:DUF2398 family protein n=1 Tax=Peterkaempfera podocarpi TaxID=3232308 RepID=UPI00366BD100